MAHVIDTLARGGAERVLVTLANALDVAAFDVHVIQTRESGPLEAELSPRVRRHALGRRRRTDWGALRRFARLLEEEEIEIVHTHSHSAAYFARLSRPFRRHKWRHVVHDHHGPITSAPLLRWLDRRLLSGVDAYLAVSPQLFAYARDVLGISESRCAEVPNGVTIPDAVVRPARADFTVVQIGRLVPEKDPRTALRAAAILRTRVPRMRWIFAGRADFQASPYARSCRDLARELGLIDAVEFRGEIGDLAPVLAVADAAVLTSRLEGLPMALLEAMASGLPVVATDAGACRRILEEVGSAVLEPGDAAGIAAALERLALDPAGARAQGERNRQSVRERYGAEAMARRVEQVYRRVVSTQGTVNPRPARSRRADPPRLLIAGSLMGRHPGRVTTQGEILGDALEAAGYTVAFSSSAVGRGRRLFEISRALMGPRRSYDAVLVQTYSGRSFVLADLASALARASGRRVILHLHGGALPEFFRRHPVWSRRVLRRGTVVVPSAYLARAVDALGIPSRVIRNVVDPKACAFRQRRVLAPRLFWMRAFHALYAPDLAVRVLARLRVTHPDATLVMAGPDKGLEEATRRLGAELGLNGALRFAGFLDAEGKAREAGRTDVFLNTSRIDNQPVAVLEAAAFGLPIVATAVGGVPDLLEHESTALLVPEGDADAMARAVLRLLEDPDLSERLSSRGRLLAEQSAPDQVVSAWRGLLDDAGAGAD